MSVTRSYNTESPADYTEWVARCISEMENARKQPTFQQKVLVHPDLLNGWYACMWQYMNEYGTPAPTEPAMPGS